MEKQRGPHLYHNYILHWLLVPLKLQSQWLAESLILVWGDRGVKKNKDKGQRSHMFSKSIFMWCCLLTAAIMNDIYTTLSWYYPYAFKAWQKLYSCLICITSYSIMWCCHVFVVCPFQFVCTTPLYCMNNVLASTNINIMSLMHQ